MHDAQSIDNRADAQFSPGGTLSDAAAASGSSRRRTLGLKILIAVMVEK
jgi:hypothetical protein